MDGGWFLSFESNLWKEFGETISFVALRETCDKMDFGLDTIERKKKDKNWLLYERKIVDKTL